MRFVTKTIHAYLDYPVAALLVTMPFLLQLGSWHPSAKWLSVGTGVAAFVLTIFTDHKLGVFRVLPYSVHLGVDFLVGVVFALAPFALGFSGLDTSFYWANAAVLTVVSLHKPEVSPQQCRRNRRWHELDSNANREATIPVGDVRPQSPSKRILKKTSERT